MPLSKYFGGHGKEVMMNMKKHYGEDKGKQVFYATANKGIGGVKGKTPRKKNKKKTMFSKGKDE